MTMKKFAIRLFIFLILAIFLDICVGKVLSKIRDMNHGGDVYRIGFIMNKMHDDIIIMGSSRAVHHYNPFIIQDRTGLSCTNCGFDGNGIIMMYALWKEISNRYYPKVLIYDVTSSFDYDIEYDNHRYLSRLKPFYRSNPGIDSVFWEVDQNEKYKMYASAYQYNSNCMDILAGWIYPLYIDKGKGYKPTSGIIDTTLIINKIPIFASKMQKYDPLKLAYFQKLIDETKGKTKLIFVVSPYFLSGKKNETNPITELCKKNGVIFLDFSSLEGISQNPKMFVDNMHLNNVGATFFTKLVVSKFNR